MTEPIWVLTVWVGLAGLFWLLRAAALEIGRARQPKLAPGDRADLPNPAPKLTVLVAGKDEEAGIECCVRSLLEQDYPDFEIILIDDRSTDATPAIIGRLAAERPDKVTALHVTELPAGWCGKNNAMRTGIARARGDWLLMVDADCRQLTPRSVSLAMSRALAEKADLLSVMAAMEPRHFWDRAVQPLLAGTLVVWFNPNRVNDPSTPAAYANGAFLLIRREAYDRLGGHESVKGEVNEDIHLARLAKAAGMRLHLALNEGLYLTRMYDDLPRMVRGWSRIFYGSFKAARPPLIALTVLLLLSSVPTWGAVAAAALGLAAGWTEPLTSALLPAVAGATLAQMAALMRFYALAGVNPLYALFYPLAAVVQGVVLINTLDKVRQGGGIVWRGTTYAAGAGK
jgi:cellulose synthase/poly-beta-1,6-N-acetylglucosamine synthase-like glycosyltransferase